ncbi:hypothetical protein XELAEV_18045368mg [Xenopus laevis]|uniref:Uromodulin n=1 Tax=Xenopus laevis TaxID=8355 RepID=A0A974C0U2_XENLA|nr:hypothetical protein XELAEV_18045368mg [Xenopus laevis]
MAMQILLRSLILFLASDRALAQEQPAIATSSLTYLVDTTGSMFDDLQQLKLVNDWLLDSITAQFPSGVRQYTMVEFNDPTTGPVRLTHSKDEFKIFFSHLTASGGGDCPELTMNGLKLALENSPPKSFILVLTDASSKDYTSTALLNNIRSLLSTKQSQVFFLITGLCSGLNEPGFLIYRDIASLSYGHVFQIELSDLGKVATDPNPKTLVSETWGSLHEIKRPAKGAWTLCIVSSNPHAVQVEGLIGPGSCSDCHPNAICKANLDSLKCTCKDGFSGDGFSCSDIDECAYSWLNNCAYGYCVNTIGSYYCVCPTGYTKGAGNTCVDIDECSSPDLNKCHPIATCINYVGTYTCQCPCGVLGNGFHCEIDPCTGGVCGVGMECLTDGSSYSCSDPCVSHTVLDEPWRSSSNAQFVDIKCDYDKVGWYRFIGSGGIRMPESCVPTWRCNSHIPMWLNGSHPIPADGIVSRNACAHWAGVSCLWSSTVQIKDCPGGYHVYKLDGTPGCSMTYCTDPSSINGDCLCTDDEECRFVSGSYGCYCKESRAISAFSDLTPSVSCGLHNMKTSFRKCQLRALQIDVNYIKLENSSCFTVLNDYTTNTYSVLSPLQAGNCGMKLTTNGTHASYVNRYDFYFILPGNIIREKLTMTSTCIYPLDMRLSLITALDPIISTTDISITGTGEFKAYMAVYNNSDYKYPYQGAQINLYTKTVIYIGVFLDGPDPSQYALVLKNCYATPSSNPDDPIKYYIIQNRCPSRSDNTVNVVQNGLSSQAQFSFQMFAFVGDYNQVYLHCEIYACNNMTSTCLPTCKSRATAVTTENTFNLKIGPFINLGE